MDPAALAKTIWAQFVTVWNAPVPFLAALGLALWIMWRVLEWRYAAIIARKDDELESFRRKPSTTLGHVEVPVSHVTYNPESEPKPLPNTPPAPLAPDKVPPPVAIITQEPRDESRTFLPDHVSPIFLYDLREGKTDIQAAATLSIYIGKWMRYEGTIREVKNQDGKMVLFFEPLYELKPLARVMASSVICYFKEVVPEIELAQKGSRVLVAGELREADGFGTQLWNCELA